MRVNQEKLGLVGGNLSHACEYVYEHTHRDCKVKEKLKQVVAVAVAV